jgi:Holliday junction resolvase RusA-like endonuclease
MSHNTTKYSRSVEIQGDSEVVTIQYAIPKSNPTYIIPEDPVAWARAVPTRTHGMWDSQKKLKMWLGLFIARSHGDRPHYTGALLLDVKFCMPMNQRMRKAGKQKEEQWYEQRPDFDNLVKLICDTCNTILYEDDKLITTAIISKVYSTQPRTEFRLIELR